MALTENRKISILIGGFFLIGLIAWVFFSRLSNDKKQETQLSFTTQSVGESDSTQTYDVVCPWSEEILLWNRVVLWNPLIDKSVPILSIQQWLISQNYDLYGPVWWNTIWQASRLRDEIDGVEARWQWTYWECVYSVWSQNIVSLRHTDLQYCDAENTPTYVGFACDWNE